jgi:diguanylate cyclase (GGDEF)-like protein
MLVLERSSELLVGQLAAQATTDALTGLLNRRGFADRVALELSRARRDRRPLAMAVFDIDHFKRVNDTWGHQVGDRVLGQFSEILTAQSRDIDVVARLGGEEFVVLLPGIDSQGAHAYTTRVRLALAATRDGGLPLVEVSAGVIIGEADIDIDTMLNNADSALYQAKRTGRNRTMTFRRQTDRCYGRAAAGKGAQEQADAHQNAAKRSERRDASPDTLH